jgi:hypothetical protein
MMTEEEVARLFGRAVGDLEWRGLDGAIMEAQRQGRRLRRRRRVSLAASGALAAGVAGIAVAVATGTLPQLPGATSPAPSAVTPSPTPSPSSSPLTTGAQMVATLRTLLPAGSTISNVRPLSYIAGDAYLELDYNDGHGAVDFNVIISSPSPLNVYESCSEIQQDEPSGVPGGTVSCTMRTLPDGSKETDLLSNDLQGVYDIDVMVLKPDGTAIELIVSNANLDRGEETITHPQPPGSFAQWSAVANSPAWNL